MADVIETLKGLVGRATKGPWEIRAGMKMTAGGIKTVLDIWGPRGERVLCDISDGDRNLIVAAVNALPALLAVAEAAKAYLEQPSPPSDATAVGFDFNADERLRTALANLETHT